MITKFFLVFGTVAFALPTVSAQGSSSHHKRRSPGAEAVFSTVPLITGGDRTLGDVFDYYNDPRILGSRVENDAGLGSEEYLFKPQDGRIVHERRAVDWNPSLERRKKDPIGTEVKLTRHEISSDHGEVVYTGEMKIGKTLETFTVKFDTGSSDTWLTCEKCKDILKRRQYIVKGEKKRKEGQGVVPSLAGRKNPSIEGDFIPKQGVSGLLGPQAKGQRFDSWRLEIGDFSASRYIMGCVHGTTPRFDAMPFDGIVGLAFPYLCATNLRPLLDWAYRDPSLNPNVAVFAFRITKTDSRLYIGSIGDKNLFDEARLVYYDVEADHKNQNGLGIYSTWMLKNGKIKVHGIETVSNIHAVFASGMHKIYGPAKDVSEIYNRIPNSYFHQQTMIYFFSCTQDFALSFSWDDDHEWVFNRESFTIEEDNGWCIGAIQPSPSIEDNTWMLGNIFMEIAHTVYKMPSTRFETKARLGLAPYK